MVFCILFIYFLLLSLLFSKSTLVSSFRHLCAGVMVTKAHSLQTPPPDVKGGGGRATKLLRMDAEHWEEGGAWGMRKNENAVVSTRRKRERW